VVRRSEQFVTKRNFPYEFHSNSKSRSNQIRRYGDIGRYRRRLLILRLCFGGRIWYKSDQVKQIIRDGLFHATIIFVKKVGAGQIEFETLYKLETRESKIRKFCYTKLLYFDARKSKTYGNSCFNASKACIFNDAKGTQNACSKHRIIRT